MSEMCSNPSLQTFLNEAQRRLQRLQSSKAGNGSWKEKSLEKWGRELLLYHPMMAALQYEDGHRLTDRIRCINGRMEEICRKYYTNLLASSVDVPESQIYATRTKVPSCSKKAKFGEMHGTAAAIPSYNDCTEEWRCMSDERLSRC